jgi:hypothetical protein
MADIKHENDKFQVRITVAEWLIYDFFPVFTSMLFFVEKIAYKENNLNLYSTPHFFVLI